MKAETSDQYRAKLCICGHFEGYHHKWSKPTQDLRFPGYWCCEGGSPKRCRCPRFRVAVAQVLHVERVEDPDLA